MDYRVFFFLHLAEYLYKFVCMYMYVHLIGWGQAFPHKNYPYTIPDPKKIGQIDVLNPSLKSGVQSK